MIENILYEIDNAFNESENNVADAIIESCTKALEILENSSDEVDVSCFGVFQEAVAVKELEKKTDAKKNDNKIEKIVAIDPRVAKAASEMKKKKEETKKNLSKQIDNASVIKIKNQASKFQRVIGSKGFKDLMKFADEYPKRIGELAKAFKEYKPKNKSDKNKDKHVTEWTTGIIDDVEGGVKENASIDIPNTIAESIKAAIVSGRRISYTDMLGIAEYFSQKYSLSDEDMTRLYEKLVEERNNFIKDYAMIVNASKSVQKEYEKRLKKFEKAIGALSTYHEKDFPVGGNEESRLQYGTQQILMDLNESGIAKAPKSFKMLDRDYDSKVINVLKYPTSALTGIFETIGYYWKKISNVIDIANHMNKRDIPYIIYDELKKLVKDIHINVSTIVSDVSGVIVNLINKVIFANIGVTLGVAAGGIIGGIANGPAGAASGAAIGAAAGPILVPKIFTGIIKIAIKGLLSGIASIM